jgi:heme exporter protein B
MLKTVCFVFYTELLLLMRRSQEWLYPLGFFLMVMSLFPLAFTPDPAFLQKIMPGCVWIAALLANLLAIENLFFTDMEEGSLEQWVLSQTPLTLLIMAKLGAQWLVTALPLVLLTPLLGVIFHLPMMSTLVLCLSLLLGTPILTLVGGLCVALTLGLRQQGVLLGILILPLVVPVLIFGVTVVEQVQAGFSVVGALAFLLGLLVLSVTVLPWGIGVAIRVGLDD